MESTDHMRFFAVPVVLLVLSFLFLSSRRRRGTLQLPPSPISLPIIGHLHLLAPIPHQSLHRLSQRLGDIFSFRLGSVPCLAVSSASAAREILRTQELAFSSRPMSKAVGYLTYGASGIAFAPYGPYWKYMKKLCMSELLGARTLDLLLPIRRDEVVALVRTLYDMSKEGRTTVDMGGELVRLTNNVICRMTMSRRCSGTEGDLEEVRKIVAGVAELFGKFNLADYIGICKDWDLQGLDKRIEDIHRRFDSMMERILKEKEASRRKQGGGMKDLLDTLLDISEDASAEVRLSRHDIKAFLLDMFVGGTDTSAITMEWALAELINHPNILRKARDEIEAVVGKKRLVAESDLANLPYLQAIVKETMRLHPTVPLIIRQSSRVCKIKGYDVPANTTVFVNMWAIGKDPKQWSEPLEFQPERFTEVGGHNVDVRGQHFELIPFGSGRRICPGTSLALQLVQSALGALIQCFDWEAEGGGTVDMAEGLGLTVPRAKPLVCTPVPRLNPLPLD
ncbi:cytochrome P450 93A3-like [Curcuma longa]|uniref:cytochrome P450 93A3-like n=1 Tax=Curcuma longa TaxID=136217 RepID=UPI003D9F3D01